MGLETARVVSILPSNATVDGYNWLKSQRRDHGVEVACDTPPHGGRSMRIRFGLLVPALFRTAVGCVEDTTRVDDNIPDEGASSEEPEAVYHRGCGTENPTDAEMAEVDRQVGLSRKRIAERVAGSVTVPVYVH